MPSPKEIKIKSEIPANFFTEENLKFLDEVLDELDDLSTDSEFFEKIITPEPPVFSDLFLDSDYAEFFTIPNDQEKIVDHLEERKPRIRNSHSRSNSSSRRKASSRSRSRDKEKYSIRSRHKYKSRSPRSKTKKEPRSSSRRKYKQSKRTPSREDRRNSRSSRKNGIRKKSRSRSKRDQRRSNDRRRNSRRRSRSPSEKLPFLEQVKKNLAAKGQSFAEVEEFERFQKHTSSIEKSYLNSKSTYISAPYPPPLSIHRHPESTELPSYGNCFVPFENSSPVGECRRNEPSTSKQSSGTSNNNFIN